MSLHSLYNILDFQKSMNEFSAEITFDPQHSIFAGHFPDRAIVPGVCLVHLVKEAAHKLSDENIFLKESGNIKFLKLIEPDASKIYTLKGSYSQNEIQDCSITATIQSGAEVYFKFRGRFASH